MNVVTRLNRPIRPVLARGYVAIILLMLAVPAAAQDVRVEVSARYRTGTEGRDGGAITIPFRIQGSGNAADSLTDAVEVPDSWSVAGRQPRFLLPENGSQVRFITILIPRGTPAGNYRVRYLIRHRDGHELDSLTIPLMVASRYDWRIRALQPRMTSIAGRPIEATFLFSNRGNTPLRFNLLATGPDGWKSQLDFSNVWLLPGEQKTIALAISTPEDLKTEREVSFSLRAKTRELPDTVSTEIVNVHVLPRAERVPPEYHVLPLTIRLGGGGMSRYRSGSSSFFTLGLSGGGMLSENGSTQVGIDAQFPTYGESYLDDLDRYAINLSGKAAQFMAGDVGARVSSLFGSYVYGFGAFASAALPRLEFTGLGLTDRRSRYFSEKHAGGSLTLFPMKTIGIGGGYLTRESYFNSGQVAMARAVFRPSERIQVEGELGEGHDQFDRTSRGMSLAASARLPRLNARLEIMKADPSFPTAIQGEQRIMGRADVTPFRKLKLSTSYWEERSRADSLLTQQDWFSRNYYVRADYAGGVGLQYSNYESQLDGDTGVRSVREALRLDLTRRSRRLSASANAEVGRFFGNLTGNSSLVWSSGVNTTLSIGQRASVYGQVSLSNGPMSAFTVGGEDQRLMSGMLGTNFSLWKKLEVQGSYFVSVLDGAFSYTSHMIRSRIEYELPWRHRLRLTQDMRILGGIPNLGQISVNYLVPLGIRLQRSKRVGYVEGKVFDQSSGEVISDFPVYLNGRGTVTNNEGRFFFPNLRPGPYELTLERGAATSSIVPADTTSLVFVLEGGTTHGLPVPVVRTATISGEVLLVDSTGGMIQRLSGIPITITSTTDTLAITTDTEGRFRIIHLKPGTYAVTFAPNAFGVDYELVRDAAQVTIRGGEQQDIQLTVRQRRRRIRFMNQTGNIPGPN